LALELFSLQFEHNPVYQKICRQRGQTPDTVRQWSEIPFVPTVAFKELELTSIPAEARTAVFQSSGTTGQKPSRHFHNAESLALYEASLWKWFCFHFNPAEEFLFLTPSGRDAPRSSLIHMFETVRKRSGGSESNFVGRVAADGSWVVAFDDATEKIKSACRTGKPFNVMGTAFSFVHLLDFLSEKKLSFCLPKGSRVMETGGYKNQSRSMPKAELHRLITEKLGVKTILCEYGMSELSSQAYAGKSGKRKAESGNFHFPPWARVQVISPETGEEVADGETGIIRILDVANVFSVAAVQTEDLGIRRRDGFALIGRAPLSEPRGCSLMTA